MADNVTITTGTGTSIAADDVSGVKHQRVKVEFGTDGTATDVSSSNPLPVGVIGTATVSGTVTANISGQGGLATETTLDDLNSKVTEVDTSDVTITGALPAGGNNIGNVTVAGSALPAGASTLSEQQTQTSHLSSIETAVEGTLDVNIVSGSSSGTEYEEGDIAATAAGFAIFYKDTGDDSMHVVSDTEPLPVEASIDTTGLATEAKQDDIITAINDIPGGGGVQYVQDDAFTPGDTGTMLLAVRNDLNLNVTDADGDYSQISVDAAGRIILGNSSGLIGQVVVSGTVAVTQSGTWDEVGINDSGNSITVDNGGTFAVQVDGSALTALQLIDDSIATTGSAIPAKGTAAAGTDGTNARILKTDASGELQVDVLTLPTLANVTTVGTVTTVSTVTAVTTVSTLTNITNWGNIVDDAAFTPGTTRVLMAGFEADEASTDSVDEGDGGAARMTLDRKQITTIQPHTAGGLTTYHLASAASTNAAVVKNGVGQLYGWYIYNSNAAARKVAFHNTTSTPTAGASVFFSIVIPATSGANVEFTNGITFSTGIAITTVTGLADNDNTGVAANDLIINLFYK